MEIITTHLNADFDGLASMLAARHLYPGAVMVFPGSQEKSIRNFFLHSCIYSYPFKKLKEIDLDQVSRLIVVDTRQRERIGVFARLVDRPEVEVCLYDHHPDAPGDIQASGEVVVAPVGATATIMTEKLRQLGREISPDEATMLLLGLYEDTGSFTYDTTTPRDLEAAAYLLQRGGSLSVVAEVVNTALNREQVSLLNDLLFSMQEVIIHGQRIKIAEASREKFVPEVALIVHRLRDMEKIPVLFTLIRMENKVYLIARSRNRHVNVARVLEHFDGGGHRSAASAVRRDMPLVQVREQLLAALEAEVEPPMLAADLMSSPVLTINEHASLADAADLLTKYNINVLPVVSGGDKNLCGIITRQVVEKGVYHGLREVAVREYMNSDYFPVAPDADLQQVQELIVERNQRFLPVIDNRNRVIGAITRKDLLRALHENAVQQGEAATGISSEEKRLQVRNVSSLLREQFPPRILQLLSRVGSLADEMELPVYLVGGVVRDLLLRRKNLDIDIVVEGDGIALAREFSARHGCRCHTHPAFRTAVIIFPDGFKVDVASTRIEYYDTPASLPKVTESSLKVDLYRRDFTINTMVISLNSKSFGELRDYFGAYRDLKDKSIRVLHNLSFVEDPTRIFRAVRFELKFGFTIGRQTAHLIGNAVKMGFLSRLSGPRILTEFKLICQEANPVPIFRRLDQFGVWGQVLPEIDLGDKLDGIVTAVREVVSWYEYLFLEKKVSRWQTYLLAFFDGEAAEKITAAVSRLGIEQLLDFPLAAARQQGLEAARKLSRVIQEKGGIDPAVLVEIVEPLPLEVVLYVLAGHEQRAVKKALSHYITTLQFVRAQLTGHDLIALGLQPGPRFKEILAHLRAARLNGRVKDREGEIRLVKEMMEAEKCGK